MEESAPIISVLMGVLNCEKTLDESLQSLMDQTETRWDCILCDDGSTDQSAEIIQKWQQRFPGKFILLRNEVNRGLSAALNRCFTKARGAYIARMDGDDRCSPDRFEKELAFLESHPEYSVVSTDMQCFDSDGIWGLRAYPTNPVPKDLVYGTIFCHAACMIRREAMEISGGYSEAKEYARVEDYELWVRMYAHSIRGMNIHEPLYQMRDDRNAANRRQWKYRVNEARVKKDAVKRLHLPTWMLIYALRPLLLGILPPEVGAFLHRRKLGLG